MSTMWKLKNSYFSPVYYSKSCVPVSCCGTPTEHDRSQKIRGNLAFSWTWPFFLRAGHFPGLSSGQWLGQWPFLTFKFMIMSFPIVFHRDIDRYWNRDRNRDRDRSKSILLITLNILVEIKNVFLHWNQHTILSNKDFWLIQFEVSHFFRCFYDNLVIW